MFFNRTKWKSIFSLSVFRMHHSFYYSSFWEIFLYDIWRIALFLISFWTRKLNSTRLSLYIQCVANVHTILTRKLIKLNVIIETLRCKSIGITYDSCIFNGWVHDSLQFTPIKHYLNLLKNLFPLKGSTMISHFLNGKKIDYHCNNNDRRFASANRGNNTGDIERKCGGWDKRRGIKMQKA